MSLTMITDARQSKRLTGVRDHGAAKAVDDALPTHGSLVGMIRRWERGFGVSERYRLHYCRAFGLPAEQYGTGQVVPAPREPSEPVTAGTLAPATVVPPAKSVVASPIVLAYRGNTEPGPDGSWIAREVLMAAHEGSDHAAQAEEHGIGEATSGQLRDVVLLAHLTDTGEPFAVFLDLRRVRERSTGCLSGGCGRASRPTCTSCWAA